MNLIIQALRDISAAHLDRLRDAKPHDGVPMFCYEHQLDYGFVRGGC